MSQVFGTINNLSIEIIKTTPIINDEIKTTSIIEGSKVLFGLKLMKLG
jgi:hypothetical protein